ncbi:MAG: N-acetylmuramoyl-L-alanine amidase [Bacteroidia bacterium]
MNNTPVLLLLFISFFLFSFSANDGNKYSSKTKDNNKYLLKTIVIDAGHGGHDVGCMGSHAHEKNVTLAIALKLGKLIEDNFDDVKVIYTRKTDVFIGLGERAEIANSNKADLFISIHCNSAKNKSAYGTETFVMGIHKTEDNLSVAKRENASVLLEKDYEIKYDGFDPKSPESHIIFSLYQNTFLSHSLSFASKVEHQFKNNGRFSRGVKQAGFLVLFRTTMPSVLIEAGFLSNSGEHKFLASEKGQEDVAAGILNAFREYKSEMEHSASGKGQTTVLASKDAMITTESPSAKPKSEPKAAKNEASAYFSVQFTTSSKPLSLSSGKLKNVKDVHLEEVNKSLYRYMSGKFTDLDEAKKVQAELKKQGFSDAFITGYANGKRTSVQKVESFIKN